MALGSLTLKFRPGLRLSDSAFARLCQANPMLRLERSARGELVVMAPAGADWDRRNLSLAAQLWNWNEHTDLGVAFGPSAGFTFRNTAIRCPDVAWIARARWEALDKSDREKFAHVCPDFVAEVRSPSERRADLRVKMREYRGDGVRLGWLIDPKRGVVEIYRPGRSAEILKQPSSLSGEDVLPGFVLELKRILFD